MPPRLEQDARSQKPRNQNDELKPVAMFTVQIKLKMRSQQEYADEHCIAYKRHHFGRKGFNGLGKIDYGCKHRAVSQTQKNPEA